MFLCLTTVTLFSGKPSRVGSHGVRCKTPVRLCHVAHSHLEAHTVLINNVTIKEIEKFNREEMGGDFSQDVIKNGWAETEFMNMKWI